MLFNPGNAADASPSKQSSDQQRIARRVIKDLAAFAGIAALQLAATPRKPRRHVDRVLFRRPENLTDADIDSLVLQVGVDRCWAAVERATSPRCEVTADMFAAAKGGAS
jgi:hypothetical protein